MEPDPNCQECKGRGEIPLFTSTVKCSCLNRDEIIITEEDFSDLANDFQKKLNDNYPDWRGGI